MKDDTERFADIPDPAVDYPGATGEDARAPSERSPTRSERRVRSVVAAILAAAWLVAILVRKGTRDDLGDPGVVAQLVAWTVAGAIALGAAVGSGPRGLPRGVRALQIALVAAALGFVAFALVFSVHAPIDWPSSRACILLSSAMSLGPLGLALLSFRRSMTGAVVWRGAALGAACGLAGSVGVHAHCPNAASMHVLLAHGFPIVLGALVGALVGRSALRA